MGSFGENLRREREIRGVSLREISDRTRISVRFLTALEEGRLDALPGGLFPRSFVRQYAQHVGLDVEATVREFDESAGPRTETESGPVARSRSLPMGAVFAASVALLGLGIAAFVARSQSRAGEGAVDSGAKSVKLAVPTATPSLVPEKAVKTEKLILTLTAEQDCWVRALADGQPLVDRILQEGQTETLEANGEIVLSVGNAGGLVVRVNDRPAHALGRNGEVKKNIMITPETITSMLDSASEATEPVSD